ncbi:zinc ribbon domain-containing protein [Desulfobacterales bacterium HSG2]|nr:zinc ribbon domain-containing protein [Desulfobacterales bacterium HSG2]
MPIYEYECTECGRIEEAIQKFSDEPLSTCRRCSGELHKLVSQSTFHLKGSGWYVTDYASSSRDTSGTSKKEKPAADAKASKKTADKAS